MLIRATGNLILKTHLALGKLYSWSWCRLYSLTSVPITHLPGQLKPVADAKIDRSGNEHVCLKCVFLLRIQLLSCSLFFPVLFPFKCCLTYKLRQYHNLFLPNSRFWGEGRVIRNMNSAFLLFCLSDMEIYNSRACFPNLGTIVILSQIILCYGRWFCALSDIQHHQHVWLSPTRCQQQAPGCCRVFRDC